MTRLAIRAPYGRTPQRFNGARGQVSSQAKIPAPVGGWDTQSPLTDMPAKNAVRLDNFIPRQGYIELRKGTATHATGISGPVQTLMVWRGPTEERMFATNSNGFWKVSDAGQTVIDSELPFPTPNSGYWQYVNFGTPGGHFIRCVNGLNTPRVYDGTHWTIEPQITGSGLVEQAHTLVDVFAHKQRLYFIEIDSARFWYLDVNAIGGAAKSFDLATIFSKGGSLMAGATWSIDGGSGPDDLAVFLSSQGQLAIYNGIDPSSATDWVLVGTFDLPKPITRRCFVRLGADLGVLTEAGLVPLRASLVGVNAQNSTAAISAKINDAFLHSARQFGVSFLWQPIVYDRASLLIVNVPKTLAGSTQQFVMDLTTGAWCRWNGISAFCWAIFNGLLYFGGNGTVSLADTGHQDGTAPIVGEMITAFSDFRSPGRMKHWSLLRPVLRAASSAAPVVDMITDFADVAPDAAGVAIQVGDSWPNAIWDEAIWGVARWGIAQNVHLTESGVKGLGIYGAARLRMATADDSEAVGVTSESVLQALGFDAVYQVGGVL